MGAEKERHVQHVCKYTHAFILKKICKHQKLKHWMFKYSYKRYNVAIKTLSFIHTTLQIYLGFSLWYFHFKNQQTEWLWVIGCQQRIFSAVCFTGIVLTDSFFPVFFIFIIFEVSVKLCFVPLASVSNLPQWILFGKIHITFTTKEPLNTMSLHTSAGSQPPFD